MLNIPLDADPPDPIAGAMSRLDVDARQPGAVDVMLKRAGRFTGPDFDPSEDISSVLRAVRVLVVGAGGLGCELLKGLGASRVVAPIRARTSAGEGDD